MATDDRIPRTGERSPGTPRSRPPDEKSFGGLLGDLTRETRLLVRQEIQLAKTEASEKASEAGKDIAYVGLGGAVAYAGFIAIVFALVFLLALIMPVWLASLIGGLIVAGIGYALLQRGLTALRQTNFALQRTSDTLKEDKQWMKEEMKGDSAPPERPARQRTRR